MSMSDMVAKEICSADICKMKIRTIYDNKHQTTQTVLLVSAQDLVTSQRILNFAYIQFYEKKQRKTDELREKKGSIRTKRGSRQNSQGEKRGGKQT